jgi:hypothetical protein
MAETIKAAHPTIQRHLILMAMALEAYLTFSFIVSATADYLQWRHEMRQEFEMYIKSDDAIERKVFTPTSAVSSSYGCLTAMVLKSF